jgi:hypothetical protein
MFGLAADGSFEGWNRRCVWAMEPLPSERQVRRSGFHPTKDNCGTGTFQRGPGR